MKKTLLSTLLAILFSTIGYGQNLSKKIELAPNQSKFEVKNISNTGFLIENSISILDLKNLSTPEGSFVSLESEGLIKVLDKGKPNVPVLTKLIEIPQDAEVEFVVKSYDEEIIILSEHGITNLIAPSLGSQFKNEEKPPFIKDEAIYSSDRYINDEIVTFTESGQLRATRIGRIEINPIQYNPVQNSLRVLNNLVIEVVFINGDVSKTNSLKTKYNTPYFNSIAASSVINYNLEADKELVSQAPTHMVIVSDRMFEAQLGPFIDWKIKKGFKVTVGYTDDIGATTNQIKTYLKDIYDGANPMSFVLFVGDVQQIPAWSGNAGSHVTDLRYCEYTGDNLPEVYYGRFSAQNTTHLQPQIDKTLMYEQYTMSDPSYLSDVFLVAGDDSSHEMTWGNGQIQYGEDYYFNASNNIVVDANYQPLNNGTFHAEIMTNMNAGLSFANYTAHCSENGWASPSFSVADVHTLTNNEKYGIWIGNCCLSVKFDVSECFGEAALRKANGGAIGDIGGSNNTTWDEDYWWGVGLTSSITANPTYVGSGRGSFDGVFHTQADEVDNIATWYPAQGQIQVCGNLAVEASTSSQKEYYWEIYHLMGDPSVINYIGTPQAMTVTPSPAALMLGMTSLDVSSAPYAYVALSQNGVLIAAALSDDTGNVSMDFASDALAVGEADLVVTCQNKIPYINTISVSPANEPYIVLNSYTTTAAANCDETIGLNVALENVATSGSGFDAQQVEATLSTTDTYVTINDNTESYGIIVAAEIKTKDSAFEISIADNIPDQHTIVFNLHMVDNDSHEWDTTLNVVANAPNLAIGNLSIDDSATGNGDGVLDPGETVDITIQASNIGHMDATNVISSITTTLAELTINTGTAPTSSLTINETGSYTFNATADASIGQGTPAYITNNVTGESNNQYTAQKEFTVIIGFIPEYCPSNATSSIDSEIQEVRFGSVINNTADECGQYSDFTGDENLTDTFEVGSTNDIKFYLGDCNGGSSYDKAGKVYIDWNYDGDFDDDNEMVFASEIFSNPQDGLAEGTFTVPEGTSTGQKFMRIVVSEDENNIDPCGTFSYGETEDYKIYISAPVGINDNPLLNISVYPNPNEGTFTIDLRKVDSINEITVELFNLRGQLVYSKITSELVFNIDTDENTGVYLLRLTSGDQVMNKKLIISK